MSGMESPDYWFPFEQYAKTNKLGNGTHGSVYRYDLIPSHHIAPGTGGATMPDRIAIKKYRDPGEHESRPEVSKDLYLLRGLKHINVVTTMMIVMEEAKKYVIMELCQQNLGIFKHIDRWLSTSEIAFFTKQMFNGLDFLHKSGLVHGDVKPTSILLKVPHSHIDWSIASVYDFTVKLGGFNFFRDGSDSWLNFDRYKAPEIVDGGSPSYSADCYSSGLVVFELLLKRLPGVREAPLTAQTDPLDFALQTARTPIEISLIDFLHCTLQKDPPLRWNAKRLLTHEFLEKVKDPND